MKSTPRLISNKSIDLLESVICDTLATAKAQIFQEAPTTFGNIFYDFTLKTKNKKGLIAVIILGSYTAFIILADRSMRFTNIILNPFHLRWITQRLLKVLSQVGPYLGLALIFFISPRTSPKLGPA